MNRAPNDSAGPADPADCHCAKHTGCRTRRNIFIGLGIAVVVLVWIFREPLREQIFAQAVLSNDAPTEEAVQQMIHSSSDPAAAVLAAWNTGKISTRLLALQKLSSLFGDNKTLPPELRGMLLAAALDPDLDARELALGILDNRNDPALPALGAAQLRDLDPATRLLGLMHLKKLPASMGVPMVAPLLNDTNPQILACVIRLLEDWSGQDFGVKLSDAVPVEDAKTGLTVFEEASYRRTREGADRASAWSRQNQGEFKPQHLSTPAETLEALKPVDAGDFALEGLDGKVVRLSDFRGKVVLINFWATWCTACLSELPELIALQKDHHDRLAILGVSLDFVPDEDNPQTPSSPAAICQRVAHAVQLRRINYPVLLDKKNQVGGRFNGGELPTTVIVDAQGRIRRRFVGTRSLPEFEAMIAEAAKP